MASIPQPLLVQRKPPSERDEQVLDEALELLFAYHPEYNQGLSNHGPMAVGALCRLGRADAIPRWVERYTKALDPLAAATRSEALLGDVTRFRPWLAIFEDELERADWRDVVRRWSLQLAPGSFAAAGHGLIRTGYAAAALLRRNTANRRRELAFGLAYWAARYQPLAGHIQARGLRTLDQVLTDLPIAPPQEGWLITERIRGLDRDPAFVHHLASLDPNELSIPRLLSAFAPWARGGPRPASVAHVHILTPVVSILELAPLLPESTVEAMLRYVLLGSSTILACWRPQQPIGETSSIFDGKHVIETAVACGDEHAIKIVDACLTAFEHLGDLQILYAARDLVAAISASSRDDP